jgi:hypothetical protein
MTAVARCTPPKVAPGSTSAVDETEPEAVPTFSSTQTYHYL